MAVCCERACTAAGVSSYGCRHPFQPFHSDVQTEAESHLRGCRIQSEASASLDTVTSSNACIRVRAGRASSSPSLLLFSTSLFHCKSSSEHRRCTIEHLQCKRSSSSWTASAWRAQLHSLIWFINSPRSKASATRPMLTDRVLKSSTRQVKSAGAAMEATSACRRLESCMLLPLDPGHPRWPCHACLLERMPDAQIGARQAVIASW